MPNKENSKDDKIIKPNKGTSKKKKKKGSGKIKKIFKILPFTFLIFCVIGIGLVIGVVNSILNGAGSLSRADFEINNFTTIIYDKYGNEYATLYNEENRFYVPINEMSPYLPKAFISIEDERFEKHFGIDVKRTGAAVLKFVTTGDSNFGGSTITQQLVKKVTKDDERDWKRKAREIVRAIQVEQWLSKDEIIELYMNIIYLGRGAYGVETASHTYFDKTAEELSIAEAALIAGLAQSPEGKNPYLNPDGAIARQKLVLGKMLECGYISSGEYDEAIAQELVFKRGKMEATSSNSYIVDAVIDQVAKDLNKKNGITPGMAQKMIYTDGLKIYTTIDPEIQEIMEEVYIKEDYFKLRNGTYDPELQSAMVIIDYHTGNVVGLVGGAGDKTVLRGLNRATMTYRAPGSTIKPLAVYAPGIDSGVFSAATTFDDIPTTFKVGVKYWTPRNSYAKYRGLTTVRKAVEISSNVIAAKAFEKVGASTSITYLKDFGITSISDSQDVYPGALALGGLTKGISPYEHAAAYGTIANNGIYLEPKLYTSVVDRNEDVILRKISELREVISPEAAFVVTDMLRNVVNGSEATGGSAALSNMPVAGKTGTTNESMDRWFAGYTPYYVASVWVGYDEQKTINVSGNPAAKIWKAVMSKVHENLERKDFSKPSGVVSVDVCMDSGLLPTDLCVNDPRGNRIHKEYFISEYVPTEECTTHVEKPVCMQSGLLANPTCTKEGAAADKIYIDRHYEKAPSSLPKDYDFEVPSAYCEMHYCEKDEEGNYIEYPRGWEEFFENENSDEIDEDNQSGENDTFWWD